MIRLEIEIAWRYLRSRRGSKLLSLISVIAIGGVVIGVSALIVIMGVMTGLQNDLREKILIGSPDVRVLNYGSDMVLKDWKAALAKSRAEPGVVAAAPFVLTKALADAGHDYSDGTYVMGVVPEGQGGPPVTSIRSHATAGDFRFTTTDGKQRGAVVGARLASRLGVDPAGGDSITLTTVGNEVSPVTGTPIPRERRLAVTGVFNTGMYEYDNAYVFVSLPVAQELAGLHGGVSGLELRTNDHLSAPAVASHLARTLGYPYRTVDWESQNSSLFQALKLEKLGMSFILMLIIVVAAFNIVGTLTMVVTDKTKEIGILRAMGMPARSIGPAAVLHRSSARGAPTARHRRHGGRQPGDRRARDHLPGTAGVPPAARRGDARMTVAARDAHVLVSSSSATASAAATHAGAVLAPGRRRLPGSLNPAVRASSMEHSRHPSRVARKKRACSTRQPEDRVRPSRSSASKTRNQPR
jgi:lipoprotein-releasing system permease protein